MKALVLAIVACLIAHTAVARDADGRLDVIVSPNNTLPAIVSRGGDVEILLREPAVLSVESAAGTFPMRTSPAESLRGLLRVRATLDPAAPAGTYTLVATAAGRADRVFRAVAVLEAPQESYRVAVWTHLRVAADPRSPDSALFRVSRTINDGHADLVVVVGDLTAAGTPEQFQLALELLDDIRTPTLVAPGAADLASGRAEEFLGPRPAAVRFGLDGYLLLSARDTRLGGDAGQIYRERRKIRASRWSVGVGVKDYLDDLRCALVALVDDPLDIVLGLGAEADQNSPWALTRGFAAPSDRAAVEWFAVGPSGVNRE